MKNSIQAKSQMDTLFIYFFGKKQNHENCGKKSVLENTQITSLPPFRKKKRYTGWWWGEEKDT